MHAEEEFEKTEKTRLRANRDLKTTEPPSRQKSKTINMMDTLEISASAEDLRRQFDLIRNQFDHF